MYRASHRVAGAGLPLLALRLFGESKGMTLTTKA